MSSSISSQCNPRALIRQARRWAAVAHSSRGNHASGTPSVRPSASSTHMLSWSNRIDFALAEVVMPRPLDPCLIVTHQIEKFAKLFGIVTIVICDCDGRLDPNLCFAFTFLNVYVHRFARRPFIRIKKQLEPAMPEDHWHRYLPIRMGIKGQGSIHSGLRTDVRASA